VESNSGGVTVYSPVSGVSTDTLWDTKGDLAVATGADAASKLVVGSNGQVLTADSTQTTGIKWAAASGGSTSPLTTKGDVWGFSSVDARVPIGSNNQVLTADSAQTLGVKWATPAAAGMAAATYDPANIAQQLAGTTATQTMTNKRVTKRVLATAGPGATPAINSDNYDVAHFTALAAAITSITMSGTPVDGDTLRVSFTDNGTARAIAWGSSFEASTVALPTTTVISTRLDVGFFWNTESSKWRCVAVA
jgi:hypothetical protein